MGEETRDPGGGAPGGPEDHATDAERHERVRELFHELADLPPDERDRRLDAHNPAPQVRAELLSLLDLADEGTELGALERVGERIVASAAQPLTGTIGGYRIEGVLGQGGMGVVYRGVQERPRREVAIKVLSTLAAGQEAARRFEFEGEILGRLDHPYVAKVFQAGVDEDQGGLRFLVMELVEGEDLLRYAEDAELDRTARLELLLRVCEGVQHAHQRGIVHRDLKPANVLVSADGRPRILDFGIARPATTSEVSTPGRTATGALLGSLAWMSPEQARGETDRIDVRTDVYSLGVMLYRLLSGRMPHVVDGLAVWEAARRISDDEPTRLGRLDPTLRGDLEAILGKALEKDPDRRYPGVAALARDLERFLALEPVEARRSSPGYRMRKFARRHRALVGAGAALLATLLAGLITAFVLWRGAETARGLAVSEREAADGARAFAEEQREAADDARAIAEEEREAADHARQLAEEARAVAEAEAHIANEAVRFLTDMFEQAAAMRPNKELVTALEVLEQSAASVDRVFRDDRRVRGYLLASMAVAFVSLGASERGAELLREGRAAAESLDERDQIYQSTQLSWASFLMTATRYAEAEEVLEQLVALSVETQGDAAPPTLEARRRLASVRTELLQDPQEAVALEDELLELIELYRREDPVRPMGLNQALENHAKLLIRGGRAADAEPSAREALAGFSEALGPGHPRALFARRSVALILSRTGAVDESIALLSQGVELAAETIPERHPAAVGIRLDLGLRLAVAGRLQEADGILTESLRLAEEVFAPEHQETQRARFWLAYLRSDQGRLEEATALFQEVLRAERRTYGADHPNPLSTLYSLSSLYARQGRFAEAQAGFAEAAEGYARTLGPCEADTIDALRQLCRTLARQELWDELDRVLEQALARCRERHGEDHRGAIELWAQCAMLSAGREPRRERVDEVERAWKALAELYGPAGEPTLRAHETLVRELVDLGELERARPLAEVLVAETAPGSPERAGGEQLLARTRP
ncbi:MAG: protein kinase [Planctomycetota bacterium]